VKTGKYYTNNQVCVLRRKGLSLFTHLVSDTQVSEPEVEEITFEQFLEKVECAYETPNQHLSNKFWPAYNAIKDIKPTSSKKFSSPKSLEAKAYENLKTGLKILDVKNDELMNFIKVLITDIEKYKTLSERTLGRIARSELTLEANERIKTSFTREVLWIRNNLGADYLDRILKRIEHQKNEIVIAVENIKTNT